MMVMAFLVLMGALLAFAGLLVTILTAPVLDDKEGGRR
jgi:hypothetical protein